MDDLPLQKIQISGPTLASMIQRFSTALGDVDGLLFGHVSHIAPSSLSDDDPLGSSSDPSTFVATVSGFLCSGTIDSFYDSSGQVNVLALRRLLADRVPLRSLIGWFSGRRRSPLRPSLRESSVTACLSTKAQFSFPIENSLSNFRPSLFLLFASPLSDQVIHTHEYKAYQYCLSSQTLEPKSIDIVNIGPAFRGHYGSFSPSSPFPSLACDLRGSPMAEDDTDATRVSKAQAQRELDTCAEGVQIGSLRRLMGSEATNYTAGLEDLYEKMLAKLDSLARLVEKTSAKVHEQESHNVKLRKQDDDPSNLAVDHCKNIQ
ncbi:hypothetical protein VitviT2T_011850 [Vitis vinifera]|uniref:BRCA1-A complex subunit Abraxas n=1 Tax=Vitis vinifera TaxID=29760 RepID=A0ABY9CEG5_VITVI|nr:hypothetical protein VitviT2T_011850 [Vitis vinifera]